MGAEGKGVEMAVGAMVAAATEVAMVEATVAELGVEWAVERAEAMAVGLVVEWAAVTVVVRMVEGVRAAAKAAEEMVGAARAAVAMEEVVMAVAKAAAGRVGVVMAVAAMVGAAMVQKMRQRPPQRSRCLELWRPASTSGQLWTL